MNEAPKRNVGRKKGFEIGEVDFEILMKALNMTRKEVAQLCNAKLTPQAVSSWRYEGSIPLPYLNIIASKILEKVKGRPLTEVDKAALKILTDAEILAKVEAISGSALPIDGGSSLVSVRKQVWNDANQLRSEGKSAEPSCIDALESIEDRKQVLSKFGDKELIQELQQRGWKFSLTLEKGDV